MKKILIAGLVVLMAVLCFGGEIQGKAYQTFLASTNTASPVIEKLKTRISEEKMIMNNVQLIFKDNFSTISTAQSRIDSIINQVNGSSVNIGICGIYLEGLYGNKSKGTTGYIDIIINDINSMINENNKGNSTGKEELDNILKRAKELLNRANTLNKEMIDLINSMQ